MKKKQTLIFVMRLMLLMSYIYLYFFSFTSDASDLNDKQQMQKEDEIAKHVSQKIRNKKIFKKSDTNIVEYLNKKEAKLEDFNYKDKKRQNLLEKAWKNGRFLVAEKLSSMGAVFGDKFNANDKIDFMSSMSAKEKKKTKEYPAVVALENGNFALLQSMMKHETFKRYFLESKKGERNFAHLFLDKIFTLKKFPNNIDEIILNLKQIMADKRWFRDNLLSEIWSYCYDKWENTSEEMKLDFEKICNNFVSNESMVSVLDESLKSLKKIGVDAGNSCSSLNKEASVEEEIEIEEDDGNKNEGDSVTNFKMREKGELTASQIFSDDQKIDSTGES